MLADTRCDRKNFIPVLKSVCEDKGIEITSGLRKDELFDICCGEVELFLMADFRGKVVEVKINDKIAITRETKDNKKYENYIVCETTKWGKGKKRGKFGGYGKFKGSNCKVKKCVGNQCETTEHEKVKIRGFNRGWSVNLERNERDRTRIQSLL